MITSTCDTILNMASLYFNKVTKINIINMSKNNVESLDKKNEKNSFNTFLFLLSNTNFLLVK